MKNLTSILLAPLLFSQYAYALWRGFNLAAQRPTGGCKTQEDWTNDFNTLKSLPGNFDSARLYASSDCDTLKNAVPAALATGIRLLVGVWTQDANHYEAEKQALLAAVKQYGHKWMVAVSVGSEDLYRGDTNADTIAGQIYDVRGMLSTVNAQSIWVGHVDTWTVWVKPENAAVIRACDFVGTDGYPYFQGAEIGQAWSVFWKSVNDVRAVVKGINNKPVWITETGSPVSGPNFGAAVASVQDAAAYWKGVACQSFGTVDTFWYILHDYTSSLSFGVLDAQSKPLFDLSC